MAKAKTPRASHPLGTDSQTRNSNGRFKKGHCPNPNGRPPKPKLSPLEVLTGLLDEPIAMSDQTGRRQVPVSEALARTVVNYGLKNPAFALKLLQCAQEPGRSVAHDQSVDSAEDEGVIASYLAREKHRRTRIDAVAPTDATDDDETADG